MPREKATGLASFGNGQARGRGEPKVSAGPDACERTRRVTRATGGAVSVQDDEPAIDHSSRSAVISRGVGNANARLSLRGGRADTPGSPCQSPIPLQFFATTSSAIPQVAAAIAWSSPGGS